jgi:hypothetical protein
MGWVSSNDLIAVAVLAGVSVSAGVSCAHHLRHHQQYHLCIIYIYMYLFSFPVLVYSMHACMPVKTRVSAGVWDPLSSNLRPRHLLVLPSFSSLLHSFTSI